MDTDQFELRKREHILLSLRPENQADGLSGLNEINLVHEALPDLDFEEVKIQVTSLGQARVTPFYVAGMTAGHPDASHLNRIIAQACERRGWAMGIGSQRRQIEGDALDGWRQFREAAPQLEVFANLGVSQLASLVARGGFSRLESVFEGLEPAAFAIHTNPLQEALQGEGTPHFKGSHSAIEECCRYLKARSRPVSVLLKETGCGFSERTLSKLGAIGLAAIDVSGLGGTHWGRIEGARAESRTQSVLSEAAEVFKNWGISTVESVQNATRAFVSRNGGRSPEVWASGGVRTGLDAAKLLALGAVRVGFAKPVLEAALQGEDALDLWMQKREYELKVAMFCTGSSRVADLAKSRTQVIERRRVESKVRDEH